MSEQELDSFADQRRFDEHACASADRCVGNLSGPVNPTDRRSGTHKLRRLGKLALTEDGHWVHRPRTGEVVFRISNQRGVQKREMHSKVLPFHRELARSIAEETEMKRSISNCTSPFVRCNSPCLACRSDLYSGPNPQSQSTFPFTLKFLNTKLP